MQIDASQGIGDHKDIYQPKDILRQVLDVEQVDEVLEPPGKDGIGCGKQGGKDGQDGQSNHNSAQDRPELCDCASPLGEGCGRRFSEINPSGRAMMLPTRRRYPKT